MSLALVIGAVTAPPPMPAAYSGRGPCTDCPEIQSRITLLADGNYVESRTYAGGSVTPLVERGTWLWESDADTIGLTLGERNRRPISREGYASIVAITRDGLAEGANARYHPLRSALQLGLGPERSAGYYRNEIPHPPCQGIGLAPFRDGLHGVVPLSAVAPAEEELVAFAHWAGSI